MPTSLIPEHIELIAKHEEDFPGATDRAEQIGDAVAAFVGGSEATDRKTGRKGLRLTLALG